MPCAPRFLLTGIAAFFSFCCFARQIAPQAKVDTFETHLKSSIITYYKKYPREKVFVHTNQEVYTSGETIWYKIYAMAYGKPDDLSKIIYVRLTDSAGNVVAQNKLALTDGRAHGDMVINPKIKTGWYRLKAFTSWMMNFDREAYYTQKVYILNLTDSINNLPANAIAPKTYHIAFYPEGGDIIDGNLVNIAFKAYSDDGQPAYVTGTMKDNTKKTQTPFTTLHDGMGQFTIEAAAGSPLSASVQFPDGSRQEIKLPAIKSSGLYLQATQSAGKIALRLGFSGPAKKFENCMMVAFQNNGKVITYPLKLSRGINEFELDNAIFSTGILRLTVFDSDDLPQAERLLFINKHDVNVPTLKADTFSVSPHGLNSFSMRLNDNETHPLHGNFSVAVTDGSLSDKTGPLQNIFSALLLSPELKGEINNPGYYFKNESDSLSRQLDLVMLTNGWRHFKWDTVLNNIPIALKYPVERSQFIAGKIMGYHLGASDQDQFKIKLIIANQDSSKYIGYVMPDSTGSFILNNYNHSGTSEIYFEAVDKKNHKQKVSIAFTKTFIDTLKLPADTFGDLPETKPVINLALLDKLANGQRNPLVENEIVLKAVDIKGKRQTPTDLLVKSHVNNFVAEPAYTLDLVNNNYPDMGIIDYMRGKFPGLQISGDENQASFLYRGGNSLSIGAATYGPREPDTKPVNGAFLPYFYLNETPIHFDDLKDISLTDVALIRFMPPPVWFAPYNGGNVGAIVIYTKKQGEDVAMIKKETFDRYTFNGFSVTREFSSPDYGKSKQSGIADNRVTLYWNHDLDSDSNGVLKFRFYNSDAAKSSRVIIQGMDNEGRLVYINQDFPQK